MLAIPTIDIRDGRVAQAAAADSAERPFGLDDPLDVAREWVRLGFHRLHVVDLNAATGRGLNEAGLRQLLDDDVAALQVGGAVRSSERVESLLQDGAAWVVVGTRAIEEPDWVNDIAASSPGKVIVAMDVRDRRLFTHGGERESRRSALDVAEELSAVPLAALLVTALRGHGPLEVADLVLLEDLVEQSAWPVLARGGTTSFADLRSLEDRGVAGVVLGQALYSGALDARRVADEFAQ